MSRTVDERVVEMRFDNKQFESNVQTSMSTLDKLKKSLNLEGASKGLENVNAAAKGFDASPLSNGIEAVRTKFSALQVMGITALSNITNSAVNAGKRIASALTIDPIKSGFQEYETQINSVQTILANTSSKGTTLDQVNSALDELNHYADKTIYNFTEMTRNIGTFTAAGIDLDTSVNAIQGIANLAAVSGSNSQQASTAMYQLSQALASGTVKLMDWNSVVNAGMGGQVFQDALKETSERLGTGAEAAIKAEGSFRESLTTGWLTADVLTETLKKFTTSGANEYVAEYTGLSAEAVQAALDSAEAQYGEADAIDKASEALAQKSGKSKDEIKSALEMAKTAEDAATKVKTFSQLIDTLKEAVQSGWTQSWETIIGDFEEAKSLFTELSDTFGGVIQESADARNAMLEGWAKLGGRQDLIDSFWNIYKALANVITPIRDAFQEIFPPTTSEQLKAFTEGLKEFTSKLILNDSQMENLRNTFKGFFAVVDIGVTFLKDLAGGIIEIVGSLLGFGSGILGATGSIGDFLSNLRDSIKEADIFGTVIDKVVGFITGAIGKVKDFGSSIKDSFVSPDFSGFMEFMSSLAKFAGSVGSKVVEAFSSIGSAIAGMFGEDDIFDALNNMLTTGILVYVVKFVKGLKDTFETAGGVLENVTGILDDVRGCFQAYQEQLKAGTLLKIATAIGILAASIFVISTIDATSLGQAISAITTLFVELIGALAVFNAMSTNLKGVTKSIGLMIGISVAVLILSGAMKRLAELDWPGLAKGLIGVAGLVGILIGTAKLMDDTGGSITKFAGQMVIMSIAIGALALVAKMLGSMSWSELGKAGAGILGLVSILVAAAKIMDSENASITKFAGQMLVMSLAIGALSLVAKMLGSMSWSELGKAGAGILGLTVMLVAAAKIMDSDSASITKFGGQMLLMAASLAIIAPVLKSLGSMSWESIAKGLVAIAGALGILAVALNLMQGTLAGSAALLVASAALAIMTPVLLALGAMSWESIAKGLVALAGAFAVVGIAGALLAPVIPAIIGLGIAFALLGVGMLGLGAGLTLIGIGLTAIATAGAAAATSLVASITIIVTGLLDLIPTIAGKIGEAIIAIAQVIGECAPALADALLKLVASVLESLAEYVPQMVESLVTLWVGILSSLTEHMPELINSLFDFLIAVLNGLSARMPEFIEAGVGLIASILNGIAQALGPLVELVVGPLAEGIGNALAKIADSMAPIVESISQAIQSICDAFISLVEQISPIIDSITGLVQQLGESIALVFQSVSDIISTCGETIATVLGGVAEIIETTFSGISEAISSVGDSIRTVLDGIAGIIEAIGEAALNAGTGFENLANGVKTITELNLADMAISMAAVATGIGAIATHAGGIADVGTGMQQIKDAVSNSASQFSAMAISISTALSLLNLIGPAASSAADAVSSAVSAMGVSFSGVFSSMLKSALSAVTGSIGAFSAAGRNLSQGLQNGIKSGIAPIAKLVSSTMKAAALSVKAASPAFLANGMLLMTMLATGLRAGAGGLQSTLASIVSTAAATLNSYQSRFMIAGMFMAQGFANGISANASLAAMAARSMAERAIAAAKEATGEQSPSKVFKQIGAYAAIGLANGIKENSKTAEEASSDMGTALLTSMQKRLQIHSPSVVFNKEVGRYVVQGIAEGIKKDTSAENAAKQKASNIVSAFKSELDKFDRDKETADLEYQLWANTEGKTATEAEKTAKEAEKNLSQLVAQENKVKLASDEYQATMIEFGETAESTQEAYNKLLQEKITQSQLSAQLAQVQQQEFDSNRSSLNSFIGWMNDSGAALSKMGFSNAEINAAAKSASGYSGDLSFDFSKVTSGSTWSASEMEEGFVKVGEAVSTGLANGITSANTAPQTAAAVMAQGVLNTAKGVLGVHSPSKEFYKIGSFSVQGFVNAFADAKSMVDNAANSIGKAAMSSLGSAVTAAKSLGSTPTIRPVLDMASVKSTNIKIGAGVDTYLSKPVNAVSQAMRDAQSEINASNQKVVDSINSLREDLDGLRTSVDAKETNLYVDSKKLAASIAKPMNRELNILSKRGAY